MDHTYWFEDKKNDCYDATLYCLWRPYQFNFESMDLDEQNKCLTLHSFCDWFMKAVFGDINYLVKNTIHKQPF